MLRGRQEEKCGRSGSWHIHRQENCKKTRICEIQGVMITNSQFKSAFLDVGTYVIEPVRVIGLRNEEISYIVKE